WLDETDRSLAQVRTTSVLAQSEPLELGEEPYDADISGKTILLDGIYDGLREGRLIIVEGERSDLPGTRGVRAAEEVAIASCRQSVEAGPGRSSSRPHTTVVLPRNLTYPYKRDTLSIYGNVVPATHGQTQRETLGNGNAALARQRFTLKQSPLTY